VTEFIERRDHNRTAILTLNRPEVRNALHPPMMKELLEAVRAADSDDAIQVIVITGKGSSFGAGYDLKYDWDAHRGGNRPFNYRESLRYCLEVEMSPFDCVKPTISMVRGHCLGASCELALFCCITFASETAKFGEPEIRFSAPAPALILPWLIGVKKARELLYSGDSIDASAALAMGLVNRVYPDDQLEAETLAFADRISNVAPEALQMAKLGVNRAMELMGVRSALNYANELNSLVYSQQTGIYKEFFGKSEGEGLKTALGWLKEKFEGEEGGKR
jgi:enoyl-CoA hydratase